MTREEKAILKTIKGTFKKGSFFSWYDSKDDNNPYWTKKKQDKQAWLLFSSHILFLIYLWVKGCFYNHVFYISSGNTPWGVSLVIFTLYSIVSLLFYTFNNNHYDYLTEYNKYKNKCWSGTTGWTYKPVPSFVRIIPYWLFLSPMSIVVKLYNYVMETKALNQAVVNLALNGKSSTGFEWNKEYDQKWGIIHAKAQNMFPSKISPNVTYLVYKSRIDTVDEQLVQTKDKAKKAIDLLEGSGFQFRDHETTKTLVKSLKLKVSEINACQTENNKILAKIKEDLNLYSSKVKALDDFSELLRAARIEEEAKNLISDMRLELDSIKSNFENYKSSIDSLEKESLAKTLSEASVIIPSDELVRAGAK